MAWRIRDYLHQVESALRESGTVRAEGGAPPMLSMVDLQVLARGPDAEGRELAPRSRLATLAELESAPTEALPRLLLAAFRRHDGLESAMLRRGMHLRVGTALARHGRAEGLSPLEEWERMLAARRGEDMTAMLDATLARWEESKVAEGRRRGLAEGVERGRAEGVKRGRAEGVERGLAEGVERGLAEGVAQGRVALLRRLAALRFGADVAGQVSALLADVTDVARLDEAGEWLLECDTGEALLGRLRVGRGGAGNGAPG